MEDKLKYLENLNQEQKKAVESIDGPFFVVAGAGTGKTRTLTSRVAYLIDVVGVNPNKILTVTFTNKAAREMKERINKLLGNDYLLPWVLTFHAFGLRILKTNINLLNNGLDKNFTVIDDDEQEKIVKDILKKLSLEKEYKPNKILSIISNYKMYETKPFFDEETFFNILNRYKKYLIKNNLCDFDDLLIYTKELLSNNTEIKNKYNKYFEYILVDEFQDTDLVQLEIIKLLRQTNKNIFVVGDPDQSIYSFRGARYENNRDFINYFNPTKIILSKNYRSTSNILGLANKVIKNNLDREEKDLVPNKLKGEPIKAKVFDSDYQEANYVCNEIIELVANGYNYKDIAILYRSNYVSRIFEETLIKSGISYVVYGGMSFFQRKEIKDMLAYLNVVCSDRAWFYLQRIINVPKRKIGEQTFMNIYNYSEANNLGILDTLKTYDATPLVRKELDNFVSFIEATREKLLSDEVSLVDILQEVYINSGYKNMLTEDLEEDRLENIMELKSILRRGDNYYTGTRIEKLADTLNEISLLTDKDKNDFNTDSVVISTFHQVKGLEFKVVFMVALEEGIIPSSQAIVDSFVEEERRIAYVGITRAMNKLYLTAAKRRSRFGKIDNLPKSRFLEEALESAIKPFKQVNIQKEYIDKNNLKLNKVSEFNAGDICYHEIFGKGTIVSVDEKFYTVAFSKEYGIKKFTKNSNFIFKLTN